MLETTLPWYAVRVRSRCERIAAALLRNKGLEQFVPLYRDRRRWSDRFKQVEVPLFPGYVFCRFDAARRLPILMTPGVVHVVGFGADPAPVDEGEIRALQAIVASGLPAEPWPYLHAGDRVRVDYGALSGLEGLLVEVKTRHRLVVSVTLLQRSVSVEIDRDWITPVNKFAAALRLTGTGSRRLAVSR